MRAAFRLRLLEARRRGGVPLLAAALLAVAAVARWSGDTPDGRYGLASDLAAALGYLCAVFYGAFPLAIDRERKRSYLPSASPVRPWSWALGSAAGAAAVAGLATLVLFAAAGAGATLGGGVPTHAVGRLPAELGTLWLPVPPIRAEGAARMRLVFRTWLVAADPQGAPDAARVEVDGRAYVVYPDVPLTVPVEGDVVRIRNLSPEFAVGLVAREVRSLEEPRPFLANAVLAGVPPALGAAALAALGAAAGANLTAPVAALLTALVLVLASLKGFLGETLAFQGAAAHAGEGAAAPSDATREAARALVTAMLAGLPDLAELDRSGQVALGEWTGLRRSGRALGILGLALLAATALGGLGVHLRRIP